MRRAAVIWPVIGVLLVVLISWVASNTYWADTKVPMPPRGEALINPFYAVQRFAEALGARTAWHRVLTIPPSDSVIVLSDWHWSLSARRREALERWVESGGRLVVDASLLESDDAFERWSGVVREYQELDDSADAAAANYINRCHKFWEEHDGGASTSPASGWLCDVDLDFFLASNSHITWALRDASTFQAMRVPVGRGSVTVINATPFGYRSLFDGDHGWLFVAATQLRRGDDVHFFSEEDHPSLLALLWQYGAPVVVLTLAIAGLMLWRGGVRLGPIAAPPPLARRSLAEQICGSGQFAVRHGGGEALHAACVRALDEAALRRLRGYARLAAGERVAALAGLTGFERDALAKAIHHPGLRRADEIRSTIALLETARRRTLTSHTQPLPGPYGPHRIGRGR